ncbi:MAG: hypothetical protein SGARI_005232 [Bacillariaceae sp.]
MSVESCLQLLAVNIKSILVRLVPSTQANRVPVGLSEGASEGAADGLVLGLEEATADGLPEGAVDGPALALEEGTSEGAADGASLGAVESSVHMLMLK